MEMVCQCRLLPAMAIFFIPILLFLFSLSPVMASDLQTYIVHVRQQEATIFAHDDRDHYYRSFLTLRAQTLGQSEQFVHTYHNVLSGFAARLSEQEVRNMQEKAGFISAIPDEMLRLHTTYSPNFLGLHVETGVWKDSNFGKGVIIGVLDTGVLPSHPSFSDAGMPRPTAKWKGRCDFNVSDCNNKLIGARNFVTNGTSRTESPLDIHGHGTHTASTAAGAFVRNVEVLGNSYGTASGMAPLAHLAIYRVCALRGCSESDILAGLDSAVEDGVDVISISLGGNPKAFYLESIAIGSFAAIQKGIFVSCSAGNSGPTYSKVENDAPWILTVGASTMDRSIRATVKPGSGAEFDGESLYQPNDFASTVLLPLVYAGTCTDGSFDGMNVQGKVVLCETSYMDWIAEGVNVLNAGGAAMILMNEKSDPFGTYPQAHVLPASQVTYADGVAIKNYINSSSSASTETTTILFKGTVFGSYSSPKVGVFSSRGPSTINSGILKPDIIGPGVSVLAAWPFSLDISRTSQLTFNMMSGTSMSSPHLSGIAALIKSSHPDWSSAAIKSAIMTTADWQNLQGRQIQDQNQEPADLFATGAGHINPSKANNPGLVYDIQPTDYIPYLCGLGYTDDQITIVVHQTVKCGDISSISQGDLNYSSFSVKLGLAQKFNRTLTNVGKAVSSFKVEITSPNGVQVTVVPEQLDFSEANQKLTYTASFVKIVESVDMKVPYAQGFIKWVSASHSVKSPISVTFE